MKYDIETDRTRKLVKWVRMEPDGESDNAFLIRLHKAMILNDMVMIVSDPEEFFDESQEEVVKRLFAYRAGPHAEQIQDSDRSDVQQGARSRVGPTMVCIPVTVASVIVALAVLLGIGIGVALESL